MEAFKKELAGSQKNISAIKGLDKTPQSSLEQSTQDQNDEEQEKDSPRYDTSDHSDFQKSRKSSITIGGTDIEIYEFPTLNVDEV